MRNEINDILLFTVVKKEKHILYIDDDPDDRENFGYALGQFNAEITLTTAVNADDALEKLAVHVKPACIYLDINMPKINGIQLLKILKSNTDFAQIPVIIFSTTVDTRSRKEAMNLGAAGVFVKPSSLQGLQDHLCASPFITFFDQMPVPIMVMTKPREDYSKPRIHLNHGHL